DSPRTGPAGQVREPLRKYALAGREWSRPANGWFVPVRARDPDRDPALRRVLVPGSEMLRGVPRAGQLGLSVVAFGDDSGDAPADAGQWTLRALRHAVAHCFSSVSGYLF